MKNINNLKQLKSKAHGYRFTVGRILQLAVALVFLIFIGRFLYIGISKSVSGQDLSQRTQQLYRRNQLLKAVRGTIYDKNGLAIAEDSHLYTLYAILDKSSVDDKNRPQYVVNKEKTATELAKVLPLSSEQILKYLEPKKAAFQVQFGSKGSNLTVAQKKKIQAMKLPGINFIETPSRLYPNGTFASHIVGLASPEYDRKTGSQNLVGVMGLEAYFDKILAGKDGYRISSVDASEYQLPNSTHAYQAPKDGDNLYLTLDSQLQTALEERLSDVQRKYNPVSLTAVVEDMKTGKVLAASQRPTFNPESKKGLTHSFRDILVQDTYEPGSVFKILTLSAAINSGRYYPNEYYRSGSVTVGGSTIHDWNRSGWGNIPTWQAFPRSSNTGFVHIEQKMGAKTWRKYLKRYHIGQLTGVTLPGEQEGLLSFKSSTDQAVTSFGQGVNVNVMQMMQAFSALGNNGQMVKPQFVDKITTPSGKTIQAYQIKKVGAPVYDETTRKKVVKNMKRVLNRQIGTGYAYHMAGRDIAVKTGTAQIAKPKGGGYLSGDSNYVFSVVGITPTKNPRYCLYLTMKQPRHMSQPAETILASIFKPIMNRIIITAKNQDDNNQTITIPNLQQKTISQAQTIAKAKGFKLWVLGKGKQVVKQEIPAGQRVESGSQIMVLTEKSFACPTMTSWSSEEVKRFAAFTGLKIKQEGHGKVKSQSKHPGSKVTAGDKIVVQLKE
jgi:penicillin-binding protein 2B